MPTNHRGQDIGAHNHSNARRAIFNGNLPTIDRLVPGIQDASGPSGFTYSEWFTPNRTRNYGLYVQPAENGVLGHDAPHRVRVSHDQMNSPENRLAALFDSTFPSRAEADAAGRAAIDRHLQTGSFDIPHSE